MNQTTFVRLSASVLLFTGLVGLAQQASAYTPGACREDAAKLCPEITDKKISPCLQQHAAELSEACKVNLAEAKQVIREVKEACQPDAEKFCPGVQPGQGRIRKCLRAHDSELSAPCHTSIVSARQKYKIPAPATAPAAAAPAAAPPAAAPASK